MNTTMTSKKTLPYKTDSELDIIRVLEVRHAIPYHSREFAWERDRHINTVIMEMISAWNSGSLHWIGFLIIYDSHIPALTDGQHRVTICFLLLLALAELIENDEPLQWISRYGMESILATVVPSEDQDILNRYDWKRFPNIHSVYENDFEALGNLLNRAEITAEMRSESRLYNAYDVIKEILEDKIGEVAALQSFLRFIHSDIRVTRMVITDWKFAMFAFNALNNIKVPVAASFLLKNLITRTIGEERSQDVHATFLEWEKKRPSGKYESFIHLMLNMYLRRNMSIDEYEEYLATAQSLPLAATCPFEEFKASVAYGIEIEHMIKTDRFGKILLSFATGHEIWSLCLWPLSYIAGADLIRKLLRQLVAYGIRQNKKFTFNPLKTQSALRALLQEGFDKTKTIQDIFSGMTRLFNSWLDSTVSVKDRIASEQYGNKGGVSFAKARASLLYLAEATDHHEAVLDHGKVHIDHVYAKKPSKKAVPLRDKQNTHRLGNLTPLCGANSEAGLKGNSSLSNKPFNKKLESYKMSNIAMTRDIVERFGAGDFLDDQIDQRTCALAQLLDEMTAADLGQRTVPAGDLI